MPLENVKPQTFQQAARAAQVKCVDQAGNVDHGALTKVTQAIRRAEGLIKTPPEIVEMVFERGCWPKATP